MHDQDYSNHAFCTSLLSTVEDVQWSVHAMIKSVVEGDYHTTQEAVTDLIQEFEFNSAQHNDYSNSHGRSPFPTLEMKQ